MKKIISVLLILTMLCANLSAFAAFSDISDKNTALCANVLQSLGIASGTGDNKFSPNTVLTRAQFCTFAPPCTPIFFYAIMCADEEESIAGKKSRNGCCFR